MTARRYAAASYAGFSLIEALVAAALAAALITVAVMIFQALTVRGTLRASHSDVNIGAAYANFFDEAGPVVEGVGVAPNYGCAAQAEIIRDKFTEDLQRATAVFCLGRSGLNTLRPSKITVPSSFRGSSVDTPDAFADLIDPAATVFTRYSGASSATNASIYLLGPSHNAVTLEIFAIYDIDLTPTTTPAGTYASVRRYALSGDDPDVLKLVESYYYDVFYPTSAGTIPFSPLIAFFGRADGVTADPFRVAAERPFYFVWWPDPASRDLAASTAPTSADLPRSAYARMGGRTAFFLVVPMFPAL
jgi:hypothetical protein